MKTGDIEFEITPNVCVPKEYRVKINMPFILAVDYDSSLFEGSYPEIGAPKQDIIDKVKEFKRHGAEIAFWSCRSEGRVLEEAIQRCKEVGIEFDAINDNVPSQKQYMEEQKKIGNIFALRKIFADFYLDDSAYNLEFFLKINVEETCKRFANKKR